MMVQRFCQTYKKRLASPDLWLDCLSIWLLSVGTVLAFDQLFRFHAEWGEILWFPAVLIVALVLLTRVGWVLPAFLLGAGCLFALVSGGLESQLEYFHGFLGWWMDLFPVSSIYNTAANIQLVIHLIQLFIVCIVFFCVRVLRSVTAMGLMILLLFTAIVAGGFRQNIPAMVLMAIGLLPLVARNFASSQNRPAAQGWRPRIQSLTPSWRPRVAAVALCAVAGLLAAVLLPENTAHWTSTGIRQLVNRIQREGNFGDQNSLALFQPAELDQLGLMPNLNRLGGPIDSQGKNTVLKVSADKAMLMRSTAYDTYTGSSWETDWNENKSGFYPYHDSGNDPERRQAFDLDLPQDETELSEQIARTVEAKVEIYQNSTHLFTFGRTLSIQLENEGVDLFFNRRGEIFAASNIRAPVVYTAQARVFGRSTQTERDELALLAARCAQNADPAYDAVAEQYTQLPPELPGRVRQTAAEAVSGLSDPYEKAEALETYLSTRFRYTLTPSNVPSGRDFVDYFLETGEGYCVYFASAMAVMARTQGIPSRLVCGYGLKPSGYHTWIATGAEAHAWVECYFKGLGWITFDPTAGSSYLNAGGGSVTGGGVTTQPTTSPTTTSDPSGTTTSETTGTTTDPSVSTTGDVAENPEGTTTLPGTDVPEEPSIPAGRLWLILGILGGAVLLALAVVGRILACEKRYRLDTVRRKWPHPGEQAEYYYADYLRQLRLLGYDPGDRETMKHFAARILEESGGEGAQPVPETAQEVFRVMMDWRYGEQEPSPAEVERLAALHEELEQLVKSRISAVVYFFRRVLMLGR